MRRINQIVLWGVAFFVMIPTLACQNILPFTDLATPEPTRTPLPTFTVAPPTDIVVVVSTATNTPSPEPTATFTLEPTATEIPPTEPPPTEEPQPTDTPEPEPTATNTPEPAQPQPVQQEPPPPPTEPPPPAGPQASARGVIGILTLRDGRNTFGKGEQVFVKIEAQNTSDNPLTFGILGLTTSEGSFQTSWDNSHIGAGETFRHEDGIPVNSSGNHKVWLSICYSDKATCQGPDGEWERYEPGVDVIVQ